MTMKTRNLKTITMGTIQKMRMIIASDPREEEEEEDMVDQEEDHEMTMMITTTTMTTMVDHQGVVSLQLIGVVFPLHEDFLPSEEEGEEEEEGEAFHPMEEEEEEDPEEDLMITMTWAMVGVVALMDGVDRWVA
uniref:Uncharacterized protein n=1 Tax=Cacopsylla melanoneura TaxID=428564 RepID=A0A8D8VEZ8_9HEMI